MADDKNCKKIEACRVCGSKKLLDIISLGNLFVTNFIRSEKEQGARVPLDLVLCDPKTGCGLLQLRHTTNPKLMWGEQYWYKSGINSMIRADLKDTVEKAEKIMPLKPGDIVVDIGCNDGTMLGYYSKEASLVGFEPSRNVAREAEGKGFKIINDFFNAKAFRKELGSRKAKIITAISMFYDLDRPNDFVSDIAECLDKNGLFIIQQNYVASMLKNNAFDNICHEHLEYYALAPLEYLLGRHGLEVFDVEQNGINGGSIRTYIRFRGSPVVQSKEAKERVEKVRAAEKEQNLGSEQTYRDFAGRINSIKVNLKKFLSDEKKKGKKICGLGASTRGNTTLQYFGLGPELVECIFDRNPDKEGKLAVGSLIPVTSPDNIRRYNPDYQLVLIWHIFKGIGEDEKKFVENGGKFIMPLPEIKILDRI